MTQYKWGGALYANARDMADSIAFNWMTAGGLNSSELIDSFLQNQTPEESETIWIFADDDENYTGQAKAYQLANRLVVQFKKRCEVILPDIGNDFADQLKTRLD